MKKNIIKLLVLCIFASNIQQVKGTDISNLTSADWTSTPAITSYAVAGAVIFLLIAYLTKGPSIKSIKEKYQAYIKNKEEQKKFSEAIEIIEDGIKNGKPIEDVITNLAKKLVVTTEKLEDTINNIKPVMNDLVVSINGKTPEDKEYVEYVIEKIKNGGNVPILRKKTYLTNQKTTKNQQSLRKEFLELLDNDPDNFEKATDLLNNIKYNSSLISVNDLLIQAFKKKNIKIAIIIINNNKATIDDKVIDEFINTNIQDTAITSLLIEKISSKSTLGYYADELIKIFKYINIWEIPDKALLDNIIDKVNNKNNAGRALQLLLEQNIDIKYIEILAKTANEGDVINALTHYIEVKNIEGINLLSKIIKIRKIEYHPKLSEISKLTPDMLDALIDAGLDINHKKTHTLRKAPETLLTNAIKNKNYDLVKALLEKPNLEIHKNILGLVMKDLDPNNMSQDQIDIINKLIEKKELKFFDLSHEHEFPGAGAYMVQGTNKPVNWDEKVNKILEKAKKATTNTNIQTQIEIYLNTKTISQPTLEQQPVSLQKVTAKIIENNATINNLGLTNEHLQTLQPNDYLQNPTTLDLYKFNDQRQLEKIEPETIASLSLKQHKTLVVPTTNKTIPVYRLTSEGRL